MGVSIWEGNKAERLTKAVELLAINSAGQAADVTNWYAIRNIVRAGLGPKAFPVGTQFVVEKENSLTASMGVHTGITAVSITEETFLEAEGIVGTGVHEFVYDGAAWIYNGAPVRLADYGISVTGTAANGDEIIVTEAFDKIIFDVAGYPDDSIIPEYSKKAWAQGDQVRQGGYVWVCVSTIASPGEDWTASHWAQLHPEGENSMILMMHHVIYNRAFDAAEALIYIEEAIEAGTYYISDGATTPTYYQFTLTQGLEAGSQICVGSWPSSGSVLTGQSLKTYSGATSTTVIETVTVSEGSSGTSLGVMGTGNVNNLGRVHYGSNNYKESALRQWINSASPKDTWWVPTNKFDRPVGYTNVAGLMHGMDADFLAILTPTKVPCKTNNTFELPDWTKNSAYVVEDEFFLASRDEIGYGTENVQEGYAFDLYNGVDNVERIKYDLTSKNTARFWFHRSPYPGYSYYVRYTNSSGALSYNCAMYGYGAAAACKIK